MKEIELTKGKSALVDDLDFEFINQWSWFAVKIRRTFYAARVVYYKSKYHSIVLMHRQILCLTDRKIFCDHIDHNGLNNQKNNLRRSNCSQNAANRSSVKNSTSKYLGVSKKTNSNYWRAKLQSNGKDVHIGCFADEKQAAIAYNIKAREIHGEFANLNVI